MAKPKLANRLAVGLAKFFYGKRYFKKQVKLVCDYMPHLQPPYIVVANHAGFADVGALAMLLPHCASYVASETQLVGKSAALKLVGVLPKKQFTTDLSLVRDVKSVLDRNRPVVIYPEAKLSVVGRQNIIKPSVAKLVKFLKVPLVTVCFHGSYLHKPRWAKDRRFLPMVADVKVAVGKEELAAISVEEIHRRIVDNLSYDDYAYQLENKIEIDVPRLCEGLESVLYKCPDCGEEFSMTSCGNTLKCAACGHSVAMNKYGQLEGGKFDKVTDWYDWQRQCVTREVESGSYFYQTACRAEVLSPKHKYCDLGEALLTHDGNGITVEMNGGKLFYKRGTFYTLSFNANYLYLPTKEAVYRFRIMENVGCTAKMNLAVEQQGVLEEKI